ncbi:MAG: hypothetical protein RL148_1116 [Planctomycetota bacterium]
MTPGRAHRWLLAACALAAGLRAQSDEEFLARAFQRMDADGNGSIDRKEFPGSDEQFGQMDRKADGKVTREEFAASETGKRLLQTRFRDRTEPRPRVSADSLAAERLAVLSRWDPNGDGKVTRTEWKGSTEGFATLDLDGNGVLDRKDRNAAAVLADTAPGAAPEWKGELPSPEELLKRLDKDGNGTVAAAEARGHRQLDPLFAGADTDRDGSLAARELEALVRAIRSAREAEAARGSRPQPVAVPFDEWDADDDDRIQQNEWKGERSSFERIDRNRDSAVDRTEVARYVKSVTGKDFLERFDLDEDGKVTLVEFDGSPDAFRRADRNGDGVVNRADR